MKLLNLVVGAVAVSAAACGPDQQNNDDVMAQLAALTEMDVGQTCESIWEYAKTLIPNKSMVCGATIPLMLTALGRPDLTGAASAIVPLTTSVASLCPVTCDVCEQAAPSESAGSDGDCQDDPTGMLASAGSNCAVVSGLGCDFDLNNINKEAPAGTLVKMLCPNTCRSCPKKAASSSSSCKDDVDGSIAAAGASCGMLTGMGCDFDLNMVDPAVAKGTLVWMACPESCDQCAAYDAMMSNMGTVSEPGGPPVVEEPEAPPAPPDFNADGPPPPPGSDVESPFASGGNIVAPPGVTAPPGATAPAASCPRSKYKIVSRKKDTMCVSASEGASKLVKCNDKDESQTFYVTDGVASNAVGACVSTTKTGCKQAVTVEHQVAGAKTFKAGKKCINVNAKSKLVLANCSTKGKGQGFFFVPQF